MSSELLELIDNDDNDNTVTLTMNVHNHAWISVCPNGDDDDESIKFTDYHFTPDDNGIKNAKHIISALEAWIEQVHSVELTNAEPDNHD